MPKISKRTKKISVFAGLSPLSLLGILIPLKTLADEYGLDDTADQAFEGEVPFQGQEIPGIIGSIVGVVLSFIGLLFFILMIYGGLTWMTAAGNQQQIDKAKSLIVSAIVGLIIVMAAYAITSFIGTALT